MVRPPALRPSLGTWLVRFRSYGLGVLGLGALGLGALVASCSAAEGFSDDGNTGPGTDTNACFEGAPCLGGFCSSDGFCRSEETSLEALLLEVTAPTGTPGIAGVRYMVSVDELPSSGELDVGLGYLTQIGAVVRGAAIPREQCVPPLGDQVAGTAADGTMSARVTLIPRESQLGLPSPTYSKETQLDVEGSYGAQLVAPPGRYDIHVEPLGIDGACMRSPYLAVNKELSAGNIELHLQLPVPARLDLSIIYPGYVDVLSQWQVDIVDRATGKVLSNRVLLEDPVGSSGQLSYVAALAFSPVDDGGSGPGTELVRLSPPASVTAPTIYLERSVVELFVAGEGVIDQLTTLPSPVIYTGRVNQRDTADPAPATVTLVATELSNMGSGVVSAFSRTVQTDASGVFEVELLPGKYQVLMEPESGELAQTSTELTVSSGAPTQVGKVLEVRRRASVAGTLVSVSGARIQGVPVEAYPPAVAREFDVIAAARGLGRIVPRAKVVMPVGTEAQATRGTFVLLADPGSFHLIARPDVSTGFAWGFTLGLDVATDNIGLPDIVLSPPFVLEGKVSSSDVGVVPGALVRAYAFVEGSAFSSDADTATSVVVVGEARADDDGHYRLLLPSVTP